MKVKDVIICALNLLDRTGLGDLLSLSQELDAEQTETVNTLLFCYNAVEYEVASKYIPLTDKDVLRSANGEYYYLSFSHAPLKIISVSAQGKPLEYTLYSKFMKAGSGEIEVEYRYAPARKNLDGESDFGADPGQYALALGAAAEYCLIRGEIELAEKFEEKYRKEIDRAQSKLPSGGFIPPRRWV